VLGVGEKLFAVPYHEMKVVFDRNEMHFVLNVSKENSNRRLDSTKTTGPTFADPKFTQQIDNLIVALQRRRRAHEVRRYDDKRRFVIVSE